MKTSLYNEVRSESNMFSAWRHVKESALRSSNHDIQAEAINFETDHQRYLKTIITQLRQKKFKFDPVKGVLKDKRKRQREGKDPRPIAIGSIKNRVVARAILQVLQPRNSALTKNSSTAIQDVRLGKINKINNSRYGVGGLLSPYGGVRPAINLINDAIKNGCEYFYKSDIKAFFTKIPVDTVVNIVRTETNDIELSELFKKALSVELSNEKELNSYTSLFPHNGIGVAQGSSLSAFAGNVLLYDFDHKINEMNVICVRYIDDILMVSKNKSDLLKAFAYAKSQLVNLGFDLYEPDKNNNKAESGKCSNGINFLGCTLQKNRCVPSAQSIKNLKKEVIEIFDISLKHIREYLQKDTDLHKSYTKSHVVDKIGKKYYGWVKSFSFCTEKNIFTQLDDFMSKNLSQYHYKIERYLTSASKFKRMIVFGIPSGEYLYEPKK